MNDPAAARLAAELIAGRSLYPEAVAASDDLAQSLCHAARALGVPPPKLAIRLDTGLEPRAFRIARAGQSELGATQVGLPAGAILVRGSPLFVRANLEDEATGKFEVQPWPDPVHRGLTASIVYDISLDRAQTTFGSLAINAAGPIGFLLARWLRRMAADCFDEVTAAQVVARLPAHDAIALLRKCPIDALAALLKALLRDGLPLAEFGSIAPLLADERRVHWAETGAVTAPFPGRLLIAAPRPVDEAERHRVIARAVAVPQLLRRRAGSQALQVWVLDEIHSWIPSENAVAADADNFDAQLVEQSGSAASTKGAILLVSPSRRAFIGQRIQPRYPDLMIVSPHELPRGVPVQQRGRVSTVRPSEPAARGCYAL